MHIVYTAKHELHNTDNVVIDGKPFVTEEIPARAEVIFNAVQTANLGTIIEPSDRGLDPILAVHDYDYIHYLQSAYEECAAYYGERAPVVAETFAPRGARRKPRAAFSLTGYYAFGVGSPILEHTWEAAYWSAQCALTAASLLLSGERSAYALCRPPGHHSAQALLGGFCYLNNAAIAARFLQNQPNQIPHSNVRSFPPPQSGKGPEMSEKPSIAILDIDYHHGNGTQEIFYSDPSVLFCSMHAHPDDDYPYFWGADEEIGEGAGRGYNHNWPLPPNTGDVEYLAVLDHALMAIRNFAPHYLIISAGWDTGAGDPVGGFYLTTAGFAEIGKRIGALNFPTLIVQEGGYLLEKLGAYVVAFLNAFA